MLGRGLRVPVLLIAALVALSIGGCAGPPRYVARTTLMDPTAISRGSSAAREKRLANLLQIATSQRMIAAAAQDLAKLGGKLGIKAKPQEILTNTKIQRISGTDIISVEVTLTSPFDAKVSADVIAANIRKVYRSLRPAGTRPVELKTVDPAYVFPAKRGWFR